jgi:hypothetical protein
MAAPAFSVHSWLYCRRDIGYQAAYSVTLPPHFSRREPSYQATVLVRPWASER